MVTDRQDTEEVRQGHVISKIADAESMAFCIHYLEASSALERQAQHFSLPIIMFLPSQTTVSASKPGESPLLKCIIGS